MYYLNESLVNEKCPHEELLNELSQILKNSDQDSFLSHIFMASFLYSHLSPDGQELCVNERMICERLYVSQDMLKHALDFLRKKGCIREIKLHLQSYKDVRWHNKREAKLGDLIEGITLECRRRINLFAKKRCSLKLQT